MVVCQLVLIITYFHVQTNHYIHTSQTQIRKQQPSNLLPPPHHRINADVVHRLPLRSLHADGTPVYYKCFPDVHFNGFYNKRGGSVNPRQPLSGFLNQTGVVDFHVNVTHYEFNVLIMGNSLGAQLFAAFEEALCYSNETSSCITSKLDTVEGEKRPQIRFVRTHMDRGGGILGNVFIKSLPTKDGQLDGLNFRNVSEYLTSSFFNNATRMGTSQEKGLLDVFVFQFPSGHVHFTDLKWTDLQDIVHAASEAFRVTSILLPTSAWSNNVLPGKVDQWKRANEMIRMFAALYVKAENCSVETVQILDYAKLSTELLEANADALGLRDNETYQLRLQGSRWQELVAHTCGSRPFPNDPKGCFANFLSVDGMHACPETVHGRLNAGLACILGCIYNKNGQNSVAYEGVTKCCDDCNTKYLSLYPVEFNNDNHSRVLV